MKNAVIYARYSSHGQNEQSIEGQIEECQAYCDALKLNVVKIYADKAISGRHSENRTEFLRMIEDSKKGVFSYIVVWKLDRFSRNRYDSAIYKRELKLYGVRVLSAKQQISTTNEGIFYEAILEANDEYYSINLAGNVRRGQRQSAEKGLFIGGKCPYGYKVRKTPVGGSRYESRVEINEETAPIVKQIYTDYAKGKPKKEIVSMLNNRGLKNSEGKKFTLTGLQVILTNKKYTGKFEFGSEKLLVDNMYPQIIDEELFNRVQKQLEITKKAPARAKAKVEYILTGKAFCGYCGQPLIGTSGTGRGDVKHCYYNCSKRYKTHDCKKAAEKKGFLEWYVVEQTQMYVLQPDHMRFIAKNMIAYIKKTTEYQEIKALEERINHLQKDIDSSVEAFIHADTDELRENTKRIANDYIFMQENLKKELCKLKSLGRHNFTEKDIFVVLKRFCDGDPLDFEFQKRIVDAIVSRIYLYDDRIVIYYDPDLITDGKTVSFIDNAEAIKNEPVTSNNLMPKNDKKSGSYIKHCGRNEWTRTTAPTLSG